MEYSLGITQSSLNIALITTATYWFRNKLGVGIGLLQFAQGIGPAGTTLLIGVLLATYDWRIAFWSLGIGLRYIYGINRIVLPKQAFRHGARSLMEERRPVVDRRPFRSRKFSESATRSVRHLSNLHPHSGGWFSFTILAVCPTPSSLCTSSR